MKLAWRGKSDRPNKKVLMNKEAHGAESCLAFVHFQVINHERESVFDNWAPYCSAKCLFSALMRPKQARYHLWLNGSSLTDSRQRFHLSKDTFDHVRSCQRV